MSASAVTAEAVAEAPSRMRVIPLLGMTQIFAWGTSFYLLGVLGKPIAADTGWSFSVVMGGVSLGLLVAALVSPRVGSAISLYGGRRVMSAGSALIGAGLLLLGLSHHLVVYFLAWLLIGAGMGAGLYDAAFGTLGRYFGTNARSAITTLTLWGGFASTICWPLSAFLVAHVGWRGACLTYGAIQLLLALPAHRFILPAAPRPLPRAPGAPAGLAAGLLPQERRAMLLLGAIATLSGAVSSLLSMHLLTLLQDRHLSLAAAVTLGTLVGPAQVGARMVEMAFGRHYHPIWTMVAALALVVLGLAMLAAGLPLPAAALLLYGGGNGIYSIARGTLPLRLFGAERYPVLMGRLARPALLAQAAMPFLGALVLERFGAGFTFDLLLGLAVFNLGLVALLTVTCLRLAREGEPAGRIAG